MAIQLQRREASTIFFCMLILGRRFFPRPGTFRHQQEGDNRILTNTCIVFQATGTNRSSNYNDEKLKEYAIGRTLKNLPSKEGALTRKRVERITKKSLNRVNQSDYFSDIGKKMLAFIGGPGTGKTASLIYSAKWLAEDGQRLLLLTYNHVLKCDLKRLVYYAG